MSLTSLRLPALLLAAFVLYTDDYVIAGILPEIAAGTGTSEGTAGQLVTAFSLTVALSAPVAAVALARVPRRLLAAAAMSAFVLANAAAALTDSFALLVGLRVVAGAAAGSLTPALFALTAQLAPPDKVGRHLAVVSLGITGSIAAGVPLGTWIGGYLGWNATFATMAIAGGVVFTLLLAVLPAGMGTERPPRLRGQLRVLRAPAITLGLLSNAVLMTGTMLLLTYFAAYLGDTADVGLDGRATAFGLAGLAGTCGLWLGGVSTDRWGADRTLAAGIGAVVVTMVVLALLWTTRPAPFGVVLVVTTAWGALAFWGTPAMQARLHALSGPVAPQALALNTSGAYLGVATGGAIGGVALTTLGPGGLPVVAAACGVVALVLIRRAARTSSTP